jgi:hypothetical protein
MNTLLPTMTITEQGLLLAASRGLQVSVANTILSAGKFEGEHVSTLTFYEYFLDGEPYETTEEEPNLLSFPLAQKEQEELGLPFPTYRLLIREDGFVIGNV